MPRLMTTFKKCKRRFYTGLTLESWFVFEWVDIQGATAKCRACGTENPWDKLNRFLEAGGGGN